MLPPRPAIERWIIRARNLGHRRKLDVVTPQELLNQILFHHHLRHDGRAHFTAGLCASLLNFRDVLLKKQLLRQSQLIWRLLFKARRPILFGELLRSAASWDIASTRPLGLFAVVWRLGFAGSSSSLAVRPHAQAPTAACPKGQPEAHAASQHWAAFT